MDHPSGLKVVDPDGGERINLYGLDEWPKELEQTYGVKL